MKIVFRYVRMCPNFFTNKKDYQHISFVSNKMLSETKSLYH